jgi:hypothetical protein
MLLDGIIKTNSPWSLVELGMGIASSASGDISRSTPSFFKPY